MSKSRSTPEKHTRNGSAISGRPTSIGSGTYFLSLEFENVRCFGPRQRLKLSQGQSEPARWTIILGLNGTGKTTILQTLVGFELAKEEERPFTRSSRFPDYEEEHFKRSGGRRLRTTAAARISHKPRDSFIRIAERTFQIDENGTRSWHAEGDELPELWCCAYGAGRRMGAATFSESFKRDATETLFSDRAELRNPEEWLLRLDYATSKATTGRDEAATRLKQVKELLLSVLPEEVEDIRFVSGRGAHPAARVEFKTPYGWVPLRSLGYGYRTLITWVTDLANRMVERYPESPDPLAEPVVVVVDEIDLHLHPAWQRKLMGFLTDRFPSAQFVATAHSPLVVQAAANANLAVLRREGDHVVIDNDVENIRNWRVDQILTSGLFGLPTARPPQIEKLLIERKKLLTKPKLTDADRRRLQVVEANIGDLPVGDTAEDLREREEIRKTLDLLTKGSPPSQ